MSRALIRQFCVSHSIFETFESFLYCLFGLHISSLYSIAHLRMINIHRLQVQDFSLSNLSFYLEVLILMLALLLIKLYNFYNSQVLATLYYAKFGSMGHQLPFTNLATIYISAPSKGVSSLTLFLPIKHTLQVIRGRLGRIGINSKSNIFVAISE